MVEMKNSAVTEDIKKNVKTQKSKLGLKTWKPENTSRFSDGRHFRKTGDIQDGSRGGKKQSKLTLLWEYKVLQTCFEGNSNLKRPSFNT